MNDNTLKSGSYLKHGDYSILKVLGQGGFGITYLAEQTGLGRKVAVKEFFMKDLCNREEATSHVSVGSEGSRELVERFRAKFVKEARLIASLNNQRIIKIHDVFEENGTAYYVMDYLPGGSVSDILKKVGSLSVGTALKYTRQIGEALDYIHTRPDPMNHLDVKPSNIMLDDNGDAVLVDFGLSKRYDAGGHQTSSTPVGVSHGYAPMEQYKDGGVKEFSPTTDIYSLGATLYKMLTGETPPQALDVNEYGLPPMPEFIPANIRSAIEKAMQPRRQDRPQSVKEFLGMLEPVSVRPASPDTSDGESEETEITSPADSSFKTHPVLDTKSSAAHKPTSAQPRAQSQKLKSRSQKPNNSKPAAASKPAKPSSGKKSGWLKWLLIGLAAVVVLSLLARGCGSDNPTPEPIHVEETADSLASPSDNFANSQSQAGQSQSASVAQHPASEQPAAQPAEPKTGSLKLTSTPSGAAIWIDGKDTGKKTPDSIEDLTPGSHKIALKSSGYEDGTATVTISAGNRSDQDIQMKKKEDAASVSTSSAVISQATGSENGHGYVDLGLSVKWATCNVGANSPEDYGSYFAWGETSPKSDYSWSTLKYRTEGDAFDNVKFSKYVTDSKYGSVDNKKILDLSDDAARVNWGGSWRMPTIAEFEELIDKCTWTWTTVNGKNGHKMVSKMNGNSIFLPAAGYRYDYYLDDVGSNGYYWSSSLSTGDPRYASSMLFNSGIVYTNDYRRILGRSVRPVSE